MAGPRPSPAALDALARCTRATLVFDLARLAENLRAVAAAARAAQIRALFAVKSFPEPRVLALAAEILDGFDVASIGELTLVGSALGGAAKLVSIADPTGRAVAAAPAAAIVSCETAAQIAAAPAGAAIAIRVSASITGRDPALGAALDGSGHRRSRFGVASPADVAALVAAARAADPARRIGLHVHHGPLTATAADRFIATAQAVLALAAAADLAPDFIDLGGAWHGIALAELPAAFAAVRAALPAIELVVEPGRAYAAGAGFACGIVCAARSLGDRELRVVDLSRSCHLRWSPLDLVARAPHPGAGRPVLVVGPTCYEDDVLGEWTVDPAELADRAIFTGITGYAYAWNTGFGGVPPADVVFVE